MRDIRKTKIVCTIGPATGNKKMMKQLMQSGMNVARLNFSHNTHSGHLELIKLIKETANEENRFIGIMIDTKGPEIRTGNFKDGKVLYKKDQKVLISKKEILGDSDKFFINCPELYRDIKKGDYILLDDGKLRIDITGKTKSGDLKGIVMNTAYLTNHKGCNVPSRKITMPFLSDRDKSDILFGVKNGADMIAASFVRSADDIKELRKFLKDNKLRNVQIIAKIENAESLKNLDNILKETDGIMVARGDLGVEMSLQLVPIYQKKIIAAANEKGKPVITATHMLESMISNPRPTRAEASDVANAILDGSDAIMLSGETTIGEYPIEAVLTMDIIARATEDMIPYSLNLQRSIKTSEATINDAIGIAVAQSTLILDKVDAIVAFTETGGTARRICKFRPKVPIIAITNSENTARELSYYCGVFPFIRDQVNDFLRYDEVAIDVCREFGLKPGATIIITSGWAQSHGRTNTMRIIEIPKK